MALHRTAAPARPLRSLVALAGVCVLFAGVPARADRDESALGRWASFTRLVESRWNDRATGLENDADVDSALERCLDDAWFLGIPTLVHPAETAPCVALLRPRGRKPSTSAVRSSWRKRLSQAERATTHEDWAACTAEVRIRQDADLLAACAVALKPEKARLQNLPDAERFDRWLQGCKGALALDPPPMPKPAAPPTPPPAVEGDAGSPPSPATEPPPPAEPPPLAPIEPGNLAHARHCHRLLPAFYEVNGLKKASTYFTPEQLKVLTRRMKELTRE